MTSSSVMIWTYKNHDSRVHNYWIHYVSLCILLKLSYMMCGLVSCVSSKLFGHLILLTSLNFACWSLIKIFCQNILWRKHLLISKQQEDKEKTCFIQGWDAVPKQNAEHQNSITILLTNSTSSLDHLFWRYVCFA